MSANINTLFDDGTGAPGSRTRRFHNKSRRGCKGCKERRIKCNELRPVCSNCIRRNTTCEYPESKASDQTGLEEQAALNAALQTRSQSDLPSAKSFTFVGVSPNLARKRKRVEDESEASKTPIAPSSGPNGEVPENARPKSNSTRLLLLSKDLFGIDDFPDSDSNHFGSSRSSADVSSSTATGDTDPELGAPYPTMHIMKWQAAPSTSLSQGGPGIKLSPQDYKLIHTYRTLTCETFPYATPTNNPWKAMTFELHLQNPHLYHMSLALASAHLRYLQDSSTPTVSEISHYAKGLSFFREALDRRPKFRLPEGLITFKGTQVPKNLITPEISSQVQGLFATSALIGVYIWSTLTDDIHTWIISKLSTLLGTREIIRGFWEGSTLLKFKLAVDGPYPKLTFKLSHAIDIGKVRLPAIEALAASPWIFPKHRATVAPDPNFGHIDSRGDVDGLGEPESETPVDVYDHLSANVFRENCPIYNPLNGECIVDLGSLHRLVCIVTAVASDPQESPGVLRQTMRLIFVWPGICAEELRSRVRIKDPRAYMLLAYYYASIVRMKHISMPQNIFDPTDGDWWSSEMEEMLKAWWLTKTPGVLLRGIVDWLGPEWNQWLEWPLKILSEEEENETESKTYLWSPAASVSR